MNEIKVEGRNSYIINHSLQVYLVAAILTSVVGQLNTTIDGIIVSNAVSPDAISAVTLSVPLLNVSSFVGTIFFAGAVLLFAPAFGSQQYQQSNRIFTISMTSVLVLNGLLVLVMCLWADPIARLLTSDERLLPLVSDYLPISFIGSMVMIMAMSLGRFVELSGRPRLATMAMAVLSVTNIVFDLLLVVLFGLGMKGAAIATALSAVAAIFTYVPYLSKKPRPFRFDLPPSISSLQLGAKCMLRGLPDALGLISIVVLYLGLNVIVLHAQGADGMFILSVCVQMLSIGMLVIGGAGSAITGIGGKLYGEQDWKGMNRLFDSVFKIVLGGAAVITLLLFCFPTLLARLFGADEALLSISEQPLRLFSLVLIPLAVTLLQVRVFLITNRSPLAVALLVGLVVCILLPFGAFSYWNPSSLWVAFPLGMWLLMLVSLTLSFTLSKREAATHRIYLTPTIGNIDAYTVSVNYDFDEVIDKLKDLLFYIHIFDFGPERITSIEHSLEEIMFHQFYMGKKEGKKGSFDVSVVDQPERFTIIVKDVGKPYNPLVSYQPCLHDRIDDDKLDMVMVQNFCNEVNYKYQNGLNCLYLNISK